MLLEGDGIDEVHSVCERLVNRTALRHLRKSNSLGVVEGSMERDLRRDAFDPSVGAFVAVYAIVGVDPVELEPDVDSRKGDALVVRIEPERDRDARGEAAEQDFIGGRPQVGPAGAEGLV